MVCGAPWALEFFKNLQMILMCRRMSVGTTVIAYYSVSIFCKRPVKKWSLVTPRSRPKRPTPSTQVQVFSLRTQSQAPRYKVLYILTHLILTTILLGVLRILILQIWGGNSRVTIFYIILVKWKGAVGSWQSSETASFLSDYLRLLGLLC